MLKTNMERLVIQSVQGKIHHPQAVYPYRISHEGEPQILPATAGITYNIQVGDSAFGWVGDHIEPGVTIKNPDAKENGALNLLACIGNEARVVSGDAKGARGYVTGTHGGVEHVIVYFPENELDKMVLGDQVLIKSWGQGLALIDYPTITLMNLSPVLLNAMTIKEKDGRIQVPVTAVVPPYLMGSGIGSPTSYKGDYDIMTADWQAVQENHLDKLKFGDIVLLKDCDNTYGRGYLKGSVSIGVVIHSDCIKMGHGPGITTIMTCKDSIIEGIIDPDANIAKYLEIK